MYQNKGLHNCDCTWIVCIHAVFVYFSSVYYGIKMLCWFQETPKKLIYIDTKRTTFIGEKELGLWFRPPPTISPQTIFSKDCKLFPLWWPEFFLMLMFLHLFIIYICLLHICVYISTQNALCVLALVIYSGHPFSESSDIAHL